MFTYCLFLAVLVLSAATYSTVAAGQAAPETKVPIDIGSRLELFVDEFLIDTLDGAKLSLSRLEKAPPSDQPPPDGGYATVLRDGEWFRFYGRGYLVPGAYWKNVGPEAGFLNEVTHYAESKDGVQWTRPQLDVVKIGRDDIDARLLEYARANNIEPNTAAANIVMAGHCSVSHNFTPFIDTRPGVSPEARYKAVGGHYLSPELQRKYGPDGLRAFVSADGLRWKPLQEKPILPGAWGKYDSQNVAFWSEAEKQYVAYFRYFEGGRRAIRRSTSDDFQQWTEPVKVEANLEGEQLYTSNIHPYFRAPHLYVGPATRYMANQQPNTCVIFMSSRDGVHFDRTFGAELFKETVPGDRTNYLSGTNGAQTGPRELSFYDHQANRYTLHLDGFAAVTAGRDGGAMLTKPLRFTGKQLHINAAAKNGSLRVEVQDADGNAIPGIGLDDAVPFTGDEIEHAVRWKNGGDLSAVAVRPVRLHVVLKDAALYTIQFR